MSHQPTVPTSWTPTQAWLVYEWLNKLADAVWDQYEPALVEMCLFECDEPPDEEYELTRYDDDDIPF